MILLILLDSQHELGDSSETALLEVCKEKKRLVRDDDDDDDVHDDNDDDDNAEDDDDGDENDGGDTDEDDKEAEAKGEEDAKVTEVATEGEVIVLEERKKSRFFQLDFNLIELGCTLKKVELTISQIFIALDFTSALTLNLNNNFPYRKKKKF